ncbi:YheT family hydrolase [Chryseosolibacter indicus]|uniref:Alpha/beta fold hydrolase n=1 Tax=Chryseosolibacter indicus TaxID=2782351 RepID=A0ABS5VUZ9_9BACT|nr:alpha/beta fold hydrolase [Chryseosolibacter indicus]MBT1705257.1 alpha/beta fold hydrolase [Chryseosolibacter indicus]
MADLINPYNPPFFLFNAHLETIYPALFRRVSIASFRRERISTPDNDFLDLDWLTNNTKKLVVIQHGLEGNSYRAYIKGMAKAFYKNGFDILAWNYRGCSQEMNRQLRFYHSGATDDLHTVIEHALAKKQYDEIFLIGFSLGGNITLKYLGERQVVPQIKRVAVFSVPLHLESSCTKISLPSNKIYSQRFVVSLKKKIVIKAHLMSGLDTQKLRSINTLIDFDDAYTAPLHGFKNAVDYYSKCSSIFFLDNIQIPTLIVNTKNDPFLSMECFPFDLLRQHPYVKLEMPLRGGHVGFTQINSNGLYWSEQRALDWIQHER